MQINSNANSVHPLVVGQNGRPVDATRQQVKQVDDDNPQKSNKAPVLKTDPKAIALLERDQAFGSATERTFYDRPSKQNLTAVDSYQSVNNMAKREQVQQMLGVDLFA